jgi:hypothetical protein
MNQQHIHSDDLVGYVYKTLDDAHRESINAHLVTCPTCRASLDSYKTQYRKIDHELLLKLKNTAPPASMNFAGIATRLETRGNIFNFWPKLAISLPITLAIIGLLFSLTGLWRILSANLNAIPSHQMGALPALACFFLIFASVEQFDRSLSIRPRYAIMALIAIVLWLGTIFIGLLNLLVIRDLAIMLVVALGGSAKYAAPFAIMAVIIGVFFYIGVIFGGAEYHYRHVGQPNSWKIFSITLLVQLIILILPYLIL